MQVIEPSDVCLTVLKHCMSNELTSNFFNQEYYAVSDILHQHRKTLAGETAETITNRLRESIIASDHDEHLVKIAAGTWLRKNST